jgi:hypothetical protein
LATTATGVADVAQVVDEISGNHRSNAVSTASNILDGIVPRTEARWIRRNTGKIKMKRKLLYRISPYNNGLVLSRPDRARYIARIHHALGTAKTWGEFRKLMPPKAYSYVLQWSFDEQFEPRPKSTDPFSAEQVAGWSDGDYPPWLQQEMDLVVPSNILKQFGTLETSVINGDFWMIPPENLERMREALYASGFVLENAEELDFH